MISRWLSIPSAWLAIVSSSFATEMPNDPRRPPAVQTEEVPVVPAEIFARLRAYQSVRSASFQSWSPEGKMLVQTRFGNTAQLHRLTEPGGRREQITFFDEPATGGRYLPDRERESILFTMSRGGNENDQVYRIEPDAYEHQLLTDGKSRNTLGPISADGRRMIVHHNGRNGRDTDLYVVDTSSGRQELLYETTNEFWQVEDWSRDGSQLLMSRYVSINEGYPALFDLATKQRLDLDVRREPSQKVAIGEMKFAPDGKTAYLTHDADGEFLQLYAFDLETKASKSLTADIPWDVSSVTVDESTGAVAFTTNEDGYGRLYVVEAGLRRPIDLPRGLVGGVKFSHDGRRLGFTWSSPVQQADAYAYDLVDDKLTRWTFSETGGLDPRKFVEPELVRFTSFDGREIPAFYYRPRGATAERPTGVLVSIHGGPESQSRPDFSGLAQLYAAELGIAVLVPNVRGSSGYGKTYLQLDNGRLREDSVKDIGALLDWIGRRPELDAKRVAVAGGSYGGYMVLASLTQFGDRIRAGIDQVGIANWVTFLERTSPYRQDLRRAEYGDERDPEMRKFLAEISPAARAERITAALLVAHGTNDPRVPFTEAQQIATKVRSLGRPVWTVYADNEGHGFAKKDNRDYLSGVEALFLLRHLTGR
jgi:dipeptidyl aminopeptidase/acylaminoacyl peptidase